LTPKQLAVSIDKEKDCQAHSFSELGSKQLASTIQLKEMSASEGKGEDFLHQSQAKQRYYTLICNFFKETLKSR